MNRRDVIVGVVVAAALVAGVLLTRLRHQPAIAGNGPDVNLDMSASDGHMVIDGIAVNVAVEPRPARPFEQLRFRFAFSRDGTPVEIEEARVSFSMTMDMGPHDYRLVREADQWVANDVILPTCGSGSRLWFGALEFHDAATHHGRFRIDLAPID
jgi:hypothetical protein